MCGKIDTLLGNGIAGNSDWTDVERAMQMYFLHKWIEWKQSMLNVNSFEYWIWKKSIDVEANKCSFFCFFQFILKRHSSPFWQFENVSKSEQHYSALRCMRSMMLTMVYAQQHIFSYKLRIANCRRTFQCILWQRQFNIIQKLILDFLFLHYDRRRQ